ncbi:MAG: DUF58 domain-containing protein [Cyclobacteriaceae bacterium]|nr:DUF58 domain-containing protein [Cyclobacteriaceae bacterium]
MVLDLEKIREFGNLNLLAKQMVEGFITGLHKSPYHGFSVEFAEHRLYNTGESTKNIDWKVYAKTDRLFTKRYEEETNLRCHILIDNSSSMYYPVNNYGKITFSVMAASAIAYMLQRQRDAVGVTVFSDKIEWQTPLKSTSLHLNQIFIELSKLLNATEGSKKTSIHEVLNAIALKIHRRSLVIIFSDMFDEKDDVKDLLNAIQHLKHHQHEVLLFHVNESKTEFDFNFEDRPHEFIDLETGEKVLLQPSGIRNSYRKKLEEYWQDIKIKCGQYKIDFVEADINDDFDKILLAYLIKRSKLF